MLRKNILNGLLGVAGLGALLIGYNSFVAKHDSKLGTTVAGKFSSYLKLEQAKTETPESQVAEVTATEPEMAESMAKDETMSTEATPEQTAPAPAVETPAATETPKKEEPATPTAPVSVAPGAKAAGTYTVKEGDTYGCIAESYYGSFENWVDVDAANPNTEGFLERRLFVGTVLTLPALSAQQVKPASTLCS